MSNITLDDKCSILATGHFTHDFPDNWSELDEDEQYHFVGSHLWQPFENWPTDEVISEIDNLRETVECFLKDTLNLKSLDQPEIPLFFVEIAVRQGEFTENVKSLHQAKNQLKAIRMAIEGASRCELEWVDDNVPVAYDYHSQISLSFVACKQVKPEHIGVLELYFNH
jgi:hypothetical protein